MKRISVALLLLLLVGGAAGVYRVREALERPSRRFEGPVEVEIPRGTSVQEVLERLEARGVIEDALLGRLHLLLVERPVLQAGTYRFEEAPTIPEALEKIASGDVLLIELTVREGLTLEETARSLVDQGFGELGTFLEVMRNPAPIRDLDPEAETLEGYLFPESYRFPTEVGEEEIVHRMVETFRSRWAKEIRPSSFPASEILSTVRDVVTLASIVEKEARIPEERPVIAGVYANRLRRGIGLYADPTVIYALKRRGEWDGNLQKDDLEMENPYNTYRHPGLPPGPICSPGSGSLEAAAAPADVPYLYFVSRNDGSHVFASTYREHRRNVRRWQQDYWRGRRQGTDPP